MWPGGLFSSVFVKWEVVETSRGLKYSIATANGHIVQDNPLTCGRVRNNGVVPAKIFDADEEVQQIKV
jgi:hypothetical protein